MNQASNASGTTHTTMTLLDNGSGSVSLGGFSNSDHADVSSSVTPSQLSLASTRSSTQTTNQIFNYQQQEFADLENWIRPVCEDVLLHFCRMLHILPTTRLLFGLRVLDSESEWVAPGHELRPGVRYCFRMRFKMPAVDTLHALDLNAYEYLYRQMRYEMVTENIPEIRYPNHKDKVMGLAVVNMCIDLLEQRDTPKNIEASFKRYVPRALLKAHGPFVRLKTRDSFRATRSKNIDLASFKENYVSEICKLAPNYLNELYTASVEYTPDDMQTRSAAGVGVRNGGTGAAETRVCVRLDSYENPEPGMKVSRDKVKWVLVSKLENIYALVIENTKRVCLEITGFPNGYCMQFETTAELESFITYLGGYIRLTSKWMLDVCSQYTTPSLVELKDLRCHGPVGGNFSFAKLREKGNKCGSCIIRQCEKEYDIYYIDINTKALQPEKCKTETFKITREKISQKWVLHYNDTREAFDSLNDLVHFIPTDSKQKFRLPPSEYDKPPLLLICLPKNLQSKKTETELSEAELQRKRVQIFDPKTDLQLYRNSERLCDNGKMIKLRADWIQEGSYKDVCVTLKVLKSNDDFTGFMKLAHKWSQIYSPHFIKLYGLTLSTPYTMIMEHSKYGALNEFLMHYKQKIPMRLLVDVVHDLVRGIVYLQECGIFHGFIRCGNLNVTKFDPEMNLLEARIADPGFPRPYSREDLPWIPFEYYNNLNGADGDMYAELWAFATTVWEILGRGKPPSANTAEALRRNYNQFGGILPLPCDDCPEEMYKTMLDGWSVEADKRFNHQEIFARLSAIKEKLSSSYASVDCHNENLSDSSSLHSGYSNMTPDNYNGLQNGHSDGDDLQSNCTFSNNSTTCDRVPLIRSQQRQNFQQFRMTGNRSYFDDTPSVLQVPNGKIIYHKKIGEGHYGTVYVGEMRYNAPNMPREQVAIKTLKPLRLSQLNKDFMREIKIMQTLNHPNIVKIKQWVEEPISIIMEYLECGSFIVYLTSRKPNLTNDKLLQFTLDIAKGMAYLRSQNVIHRDLAARNILVDRESVKISDFGLAQIANADGYYFAQSEREIPIKWYALESIKTGKFSFQSDVWSYGVTLFEMFSRGETPNLDPAKELKQEEFLNQLEQGERLRKPTLCPDIVYDKLMRPCWDATPKARPSFKELVEVIQSIINESGESV